MRVQVSVTPKIQPYVAYHKSELMLLLQPPAAETSGTIVHFLESIQQCEQLLGVRVISF